MAATRTRKKTTVRTSVKKDLKIESSDSNILKKFHSLNNFLEFVAVIAEEPVPSQQTLIAEYTERVAAEELLSLPVDENGHLLKSKMNGFEEDILEKTAAALAKCINTILTNKKTITDVHAKVVHTRSQAPIIPLEYPKKQYKIKYFLKMKPSGK